MGFITWLKDPGLRGELLWLVISSEDPEESAEALNQLRETGWLTDSSMRGVDLHEARLQGADLSKVDLVDADFHNADLQGVDFSGADLRWAVFDSADMTGANFQEADLRGASIARAKLEDANLQGADLGGADVHHTRMNGANVVGALLDETDLGGTGLTEAQLLQAGTLAEAVLPDGKTYDGRYNLPGDLDDALEIGADLDSAEDMALFYGVAIEKYLEGQEWARKNKRGLKAKAGKKVKFSAAEKRSLDDEDLDDGPVEGLLVTNPISYADLMDMPFDDPEGLDDILGDDEKEEKLRNMAAGLSALLVWLSPIIIAIEQLLAGILRPQDRYGSSNADFSVTYAATLIMAVVAVIVTTRALRATGRNGSISRILAVVFAVLFGGGFAVSSLMVALGYMIALLLAYIYLGRNARVTLFWVGSVLMALPVGALLIDIAGQVGVTEYPLWASLTLFPLRYILGIAVIALLRYVVRTHMVHEIGRRHDTVIIRELQIGYVVSIGLTIWAAVVNFAAAMRPSDLF